MTFTSVISRAAFAVLGVILGGIPVLQTDRLKEESDNLYTILNMSHLTPDVLDSGLKQFTPESKNEVINRVAHTPQPPGYLLARLPFILTDENKPVMQKIFIANLHSPLPEARKFSLYGLEKLGHPDLHRFAESMLRDRDDGVLYAACFILLPNAKKDEVLWKKLQRVYEERKDEVGLQMSLNLLRANSITLARPPAK